MTIIRISRYQFEVSDPYSAGMAINLAEAQALNALRAENIRNNLMDRVRAARDSAGPDVVLSIQVLEELQAQFTAYDQEYSFGLRRANRRLGLIETELQLVAKLFVLSQARGSGRVLEEDELQDAIAAAMQLPHLREEARKRVEERASITNAAVESLL